MSHDHRMRRRVSGYAAAAVFPVVFATGAAAWLALGDAARRLVTGR